ncbi:hypothetical protein NZK35_31195 [Stieleria sp. ICT_E10.1]|nr:hypothetical protein [Stieleria sedimenti]MCS7471146.1 hypothetical protein [Stieleria sedimenti]
MGEENGTSPLNDEFNEVLAADGSRVVLRYDSCVVPSFTPVIHPNI